MTLLAFALAILALTVFVEGHSSSASIFWR